MILFRADGNPQVASGHIMRCLTLADTFQEKGVRCVFVSAELNMQSLVQERGYEFLALGSAYDHMEEELPMFLPLLEERRPACVILDSYYVTPEYMSALRSKFPLVYIDDLNMFDYPADLIINYMLYANKLDYPQNKKYLLGPQYALLRKEFQNVPQRQPLAQVNHVLLSTGGSDWESVALQCVQYLRDRPSDGITYHVVLGAMNRDIAEIERFADGCDYIVLHKNVSDMRSLMMQCDAAISAGGTTLFELCACGLPAVTYVLADNQILNVAAFEEAGLMLCAGDIRNDGQFVVRIFECLGTLTQNHFLRLRISQRMRALVDGNGATRLAKTILEFIRD